MTIFLDNVGSGFEMERLARVFLPEERITLRDAAQQPEDKDCVIRCESGVIYARLVFGQKEYLYEKQVDPSLEGKDFDLAVARAMYETMCEACGYTPPWGMLTGVRPVKLLRRLADSGEDVRARFIDDFAVSEEKYALCRETEQNERPLLELSRPDSFSLYISIPFCPTRCSYCSFVSQSVEMARKLIPDYVDRLCEEIRLTAQMIKSLGLRLETVYMGGGTPTTLSAQQLHRVLDTVNKEFDISCIREYTVEAGRPDTITAEKLAAIKECGVDRISINPQTMSDEVLAAIGRKHSAAQVLEAMDMARSVGFDVINMDLIAGLPGDTPESFEKTLDTVLAMQPENVTLHTLAMKRASYLTQSGVMPSGEQTVRMLSYADKTLHAHGQIPYYLYRQTKMLGNMENVGWSEPGCEGLYNIYIMDETHTIVGLGAGGVTKLKQPGGEYIERIYNYKFPYEYIGRFDELIARKSGIAEFYGRYR